MNDRPSRTVMIVGGLVVGATWIGSGVMAYRGTWWPLVTVLVVAGSAVVLSLGMAMFVRAKSGGALANAQLQREGEGAGPRAGPVRGSAVPSAARQGKRARPKNKKRRRR